MTTPDLTGVTSKIELNRIQPGATPYEQVFIKFIDRYLNIPSQVVRTLWNPDEIPAELLPWLAWSLGVDEWSSDWSEATKRAVIKQAPDVHRHKGTRYALDKAMEPLSYQLDCKEWFEYGGSPYYFKVSVSVDETKPWSLDDSKIIYNTAIKSKNVRSYLESIVIQRRATSGSVYVGSLTKTTLTLKHDYEPFTAMSVGGPSYYGVGMRTIHRVKIQ